MAHQSPRSRHPVIWALITILILAPLVGTLWVPFYARTTPKVADFPFFYWYQLMWVPIVAVTTALAYALTRATRPRPDREPRAGGPGGTPGSHFGGSTAPIPFFGQNGYIALTAFVINVIVVVVLMVLFRPAELPGGADETLRQHYTADPGELAVRELPELVDRPGTA